MRVDNVGRPIETGDVVVFNVGDYSDLRIGKVKRFTKCYCIIMMENGIETRREDHRVMVVTDQIDMNKEKYPEYFI